MNLIPHSEPVWVDHPAAFEGMTADLNRCQTLSVDTESNSLFVFKEQVCLIQFSTGSRDYLVDPLALSDLSGLGPIFASPQVEKVFHAAEYDLICLKRDFGFEFSNIFDTMTAARILGRAEVGLAALLGAEFGIQLDKRFQRADWGRRPLPHAQMDYARLDTFYLAALRNRMIKALQDAGRWELAQEDFLRECRVTIPANGNAPCWRITGSQDLTAQQAAVLAELCSYRDGWARAKNVPPFKVLSNQKLLDLAMNCPNRMSVLYEMKLLSPRELELHGEPLLAAVHRGLAAAPLRRPVYQRPDEAYLDRVERLRSWRKDTGLQLGVPSDVILPKDAMEKIAGENPHSLAALESCMQDLPWRFGRFGEEILSRLRR